MLQFGINSEILNHIYSVREISLVRLGMGPHTFLWIAVLVINLSH